MKVRVVIEEIVVDAECADTQMSDVASAQLVHACSEEALRLFRLRADMKREDGK